MHVSDEAGTVELVGAHGSPHVWVTCLLGGYVDDPLPEGGGWFLFSDGDGWFFGIVGRFGGVLLRYDRRFSATAGVRVLIHHGRAGVRCER
ncbi:hypothetical protein MINT15_25900 [Saccharomonospora viridis]|uniref:Uncharacterized protein n=1 Tax=Saccharomonospora viridis TaxID=1852 RepID=A0A837D6F8_9PSEU|nr:hypothetical protein MINT15_25900 [Saccharomonospora viridis]